MSKKLKNLQWESVALEGFPASFTENLQGFVGLEECTNYGLDKESKKSKKKKNLNKRKQSTQETEVPIKKIKLSNGFIVESCGSITPSSTNEAQQDIVKGNQDVKKVKNKKNKPKLGENALDDKPLLTPEDMLTWAEFKLPETLLKGLTELGFKQPTKIQQLSLPAAIHGRRDILGAAETGSGKTLAFGLPIITGILRLKEKAEQGFDVYEIPYKKTSAKKKPVIEENTKNKKKDKKIPKKKEKESSEEGYSSDTDNDDTVNDKNDFIEEYDVPLRKRDMSADEGNDSDDENYVHLSDILDDDNDSDDGSDDNENSEGVDEESIDENDDGSSNDENDVDGSDDKTDEDTDDDKSDEIDDAESLDEEVDEENTGIGCVKVIDNIEIPGHVSTKTGKPLYALILTPTRELAIQISRHLIAVAKYTGIRIATIVGGMASVKQERVLRSGPEIVVATPGRLWELINRGQPHLQQLDCVKFLAIDETDRMIERGHFEELTPLLERLNVDEEKRSSRQNFVFSATLTMVHDLPTHMKGKKVTKHGKIINRKISKMTPQQKIKRLIDTIGMTEPKVVDITAQNLGTAETLTESRIACSLEDKDAYLYYILKRHPGRTIVFCNSIGCVKRLTQLFTLLKCRPLPLHASMQQRQRLKNLERFRDDPHGVLVATDVAARGLDIPDVDHVVHFQVPRTAENYVHRSGRTARANKEGLTILMMEPAEAFLYTKLCRTLNKTSEVPIFPVASQSIESFKSIIALARQLDGLMLKRRRTTQANGWREKAAREMDMIIDEDDIPVSEVDPTIDKALQAKKRQLDSMLSKPLFPKGFSFKYPTLNDPDALKIQEENALQVMKKSLQSGEFKKQKRKSKNDSLFKLERKLKKK